LAHFQGDQLQPRLEDIRPGFCLLQHRLVKGNRGRYHLNRRSDQHHGGVGPAVGAFLGQSGAQPRAAQLQRDEHELATYDQVAGFEGVAIQAPFGDERDGGAAFVALSGRLR
jgi:hypothetical protein